MSAIFVRTNVIGSFITGISALFALGHTAAFVNIFGLSVLYHYQAFRTRNGDLTKLAYFGMVAGMVELFADYWMVTVLGVLEYNPNGPFIWDSPLYMPLSWAGMIMTFGVLGEFFVRKSNAFIGALITAFLMSIYVPLYELLAYYANWWQYTDPDSLGHVPYFIILGEFFIGLPLAYAATKVASTSLFNITFWGIFIGVWIFFSYWLAHTIVKMV